MANKSEQLDPSTIQWLAQSFEDPGGRVFTRGGRIYRALRGRSAEAFEIIERRGALASLIDVGLVPTWRSPLSIEGFDMVLEHRRLPPSPTVGQWTPRMLRDAGTLFCDLSLALAPLGLALQDCHGWNIMFHGTRAHHIDVSSIIPLRPGEPWTLLDEFRACFLRPLQMVRGRKTDYAFYLLARDNWVTDEDATPMLFSKQHRLWRWWDQRSFATLRQKARAGGEDNLIAICRELKRRLGSIRWTDPQTIWTGYAPAYPDAAARFDAATDPKPASVQATLRDLGGGTLLDVGCNTGWFSVMAAQMGFEVRGMDTDRVCLDTLYDHASQNQLAITPIAASVFNPAIADGPRYYQPLTERFRSDHVLMLALVHHLFFKQGYAVETIVDIASSLTHRTLVLEHVPANDYWIEQWDVQYRTADYALERWLELLKTKFGSVEILPSEFSHPSSSVQRQILVAKR